jgi:competence protein ComEC
MEMVKHDRIYGNSWPMLRKVPALRILLALLPGIVAGAYLPDVPLALTLLIFQSICWIFSWRSKRAQFRRRHYFGVLLTVSSLCGGYALTVFSLERLSFDYFGHHPTVDCFLVETLTSSMQRTRSCKVTVRVLGLRQENVWKKASGKLLVYLPVSKASSALLPGSRLMVYGLPDAIAGESLAASIQHNRQLYYRLFARRWVVIDTASAGFSLLRFAAECRRKVVDILSRQMKGAPETAIAIALLVGEERAIEEALNTAYAATGTLHVLSVSGMHVGLIYLLLGFLLKPLLNHAASRHLYFPFVMLLVWIYALVAGAVPAILRAATMCSLHLLAKWTRRRSSGAGMLGLSLLLLLLYRPLLLFEPGMQLSFFAVWGIVSLYPHIAAWWAPSFKPLRWMWELTAVSMAAQCMTLPVGLYYFGQFPNYFVAANLCVIPLTTASIYTGICQLVVDYIPTVAAWVAALNTAFIGLSDMLVLWMAALPGAVTFVKVDLQAAVLLYCFMALSGKWLRQKRFRVILEILLVVIVYTAIRLIQTI